MSKEKQETQYPLRSLHNFLYELDKEWDRLDQMGYLVEEQSKISMQMVKVSKEIEALLYG